MKFTTLILLLAFTKPFMTILAVAFLAKFLISIVKR